MTDTQVRLLPAPQNPMAVARELIAASCMFEDALTLHRWRGGWWRWKGSHWAEVEDREVQRTAYEFTEHAVYLDSKGNDKPWSPNRYKVADLLAAAGVLTHVAETVHMPTWIPRVSRALEADEFVSCANGLLHVRTRELHGHTPAMFNAVSVPFDFDPDASAPRWNEFLHDLWPEDEDARAALQEFLGYIVSGRTDLHKILLLVGPTRAGKGVIARVLKNMIGAGNCAGPTLASLGTNFGLSPLIGKPLAIVSDARLAGGNVAQVVERLLSISGEDMLTVDRKYRDPWTGTLPSRFLVISNELPRFGDASGAIAGRFVVLTLERSFMGKEKHAPHPGAAHRAARHPRLGPRRASTPPGERVVHRAEVVRGRGDPTPRPGVAGRGVRP